MASDAQPASSNPPVLVIRHLSKTFTGARVLTNVDLEVRAGEVHALIGQNGSGKSTLIKILAGFHAPDPGTMIAVDGADLHLDSSDASREAGLRFVHQDLALVDTLNTIENLGLGRGFRTGFAGRIRWSDEGTVARERMHALGYDVDVRQPLGSLPAAARTGVAIARALSDPERVRVLVLDEPTASLPRGEAGTLFNAVERLRSTGIGVIYVSHRLDEVFAIADRVTVLRDGRRVTTVNTADIDQDDLVQLMVGDVDLESRTATTSAGPVVLTARQLVGEVVQGLDLDVRSGEVLGICGLTGSGREELLPMLFGATDRLGDVSVSGELVPPSEPRTAIDAGIALVAADRHASGSIAALSVRQNCTLTNLGPHVRFGVALSDRGERREVGEWIRSLDVRPPESEAIFATLSGGNQQKIVLAKWLRLNPAVLLLDEPTQGVDVHAKATIHALAREAATKGAAVVIASSDDAELCDTCDRIHVMRDGRVVATLEGQAISRTEIGRLQHAVVAAS